MIAVVLPTIRGRERLLDQTVVAYEEQHVEMRFYIVHDRATIGEAWQDGAEMAVSDGCDYLHLSADDVEPVEGCMAAAMAAVDDLEYPSPRILNPDGSLHSCGSMGGGMLLPECRAGTPAVSSGFPFIPASAIIDVLPLPPIHYYCDDYIAAMMRLADFDVAVVPEYGFRHLEGSVGRAQVISRAMQDRDRFLHAVATRL